MDLIERYLGAVRWNLPAAKADDVIAELRDLIAARMEDREETLDRALTREEVNALLKEFGHPLVVASGYREHQSLIGPELFPFYLFSLRVVLLISATLLVVIGVLDVMFAGRNAMQTLMQAFNSGIWTLLSHAALVTLFFAVIERTGWLRKQLNNWTPGELPELKLRSKKGWESAFEVGVGIAFLSWWAGAYPLPITPGGGAVALTPSPVWTMLHWPIFALIAAQLVHNLIQWLRPRWKVARGTLAIATAIGGIAILGILYQAGRLVTVLPGRETVQVAKLQESIDLSMQITLAVIGVIWVAQCLSELWRLARAPRA